MREVEWSDFNRRRAGFLKTRALLSPVRKRASKQRNPKERELLLRLDRARLEQWKKEGKWLRSGPREITFRPD